MQSLACLIADPGVMSLIPNKTSRALDHSPESWHMSCCFGLWPRRYHLKICLFLVLVATLFVSAISVELEGMTRNISVNLF